MRRPRFTRSLVLVTLALGCTALPRGAGVMEAALEAVHRGSAHPRDIALTGWHQYLVDGDAAAARKSFETAGEDPVALAGELDLARRDASPAERAHFALALTRAGADSPLGAIGARAMLDLVGTSTALDDQLVAAAQADLVHASSPDVLFLCRLIVARVQELHRTEGWAQRFAELGALQELALAGPFAALRHLDFPATYPPEQENALRDTYLTPAGEVHTRPLHFPTGDLQILGEPDRGDVYFLGGDLTTQGGGYLLFWQGAAAYTVYLDGAPILRRAPASLDPVQLAYPLELTAGPHRLLIKLTRGEGSSLAGYLTRADGQPEDLHVHAAHGPAPLQAPTPAGPVVPPQAQGARELDEALQPEVGEVMARYLAARAVLGRDVEGAKALIAEAEPLAVDAGPALGPDAGAPAGWPAPWLSLRAQITLLDRSLPERTGQAHASRDLADATGRDPTDVSSWLLRASQARDEERLDDAEALLAQARNGAHSPFTEVAEARLQLARGLDALADTSAHQALELQPGLCEATELRYDLARRNESEAASDALIGELAACPDGLERLAEHARARADLPAAESALVTRLQRNPNQPRFANELAQNLIGQKRYADARRVLEAQMALWPRLAELHLRLAEVLTLAGDAPGALAERRAALALDGGDLALRRQLALRDGHDLLDDLAIDGPQAIAEYLKSPPEPGTETSASAYVLDMAGIQAEADGTQVERIHTVAQVLDQRGIPALAEQHLPSNAIVLKLQTIKKDGRVLEPEVISDKEGVSLPGVEVGDFVEVEYLSSTPARSLAEPGFASVPFYFRIADSPLVHSTFTFRGPPGVPLQVDARHLAPPPVVEEHGRSVVRHEERHVPLLIPEPNAPGANEYLPMLQVGAGSGVLEGLLPFADSAVGHEAPTREVTLFARQAAGERVGVEAAQAIYAAVMERIKGEQNDITDRAAATLARERGSRLWLLKSALAVVGIPSHVALVRPLAADPSTYRFADSDLFTYPVLLVELPEQPPLWLDPSVRYAPFGQLPEVIAGEHEAAVLPAPGESIRVVHTPAAAVRPPKRVSLALKVLPNGDVEGQGEESYTGLDAAILRQNLERVDAEQRRQAVEAALSRSFQAAVLDELTINDAPAVGAPLSFRYRFHSAGFARVEGKKLVLATPIFPAALGQRYVALANRVTPLLINGSESSVTTIKLEVPPGYRVTNPGVPANVSSPFGAFRRTTRAEGSAFVLQEELEIKSGRITPAQYPDFVRFTAAADQAQLQEVDLEP